MAQTNTSVKTSSKQLYGYQKDALQEIFRRFEDAPKDYHLLYQLPTGGGKTVIFSEIVRQYLKNHNKKVLILTDLITGFYLHINITQIAKNKKRGRIDPF